MNTRRFQHNKVRIVSVFALVMGALIATAQAHEDLQVGQPAPPAELVTLSGQHIATGDLRGKIVLLTFWASWCEPCRQELPVLSRYAAAHRRQGLRVLAFSLDYRDSLAKLRGLAQQWRFPVGLLSQSKARGYGRMWRIPVSFVIDRQGLLRYNGWQASHTAWTLASLNQVVGPLLKR
jgi:cytochrome c biogenesis protein CcmG/thiol:disulfide interchange protein DsbE